jgi:hypothetical protein
MKHLLTILLSVVTLFSIAQTIKLGDNLQIEYRKLEKPYFFKAPNFTGWTEGANMFLIGAKPKPIDCDYVFLALKDTTLIGIFKTTQPNVFMFDTKGNSILSDSSYFFLLPLWTVKNKTKIDSSDKTILSVLDKLYETTLQANEGNPEEKTLRKYQQFKTDTSLANRHIALLFDNYQTLVAETAAKGEKPPTNICVPLMNSLISECNSLYNSIPVMVCICSGEALLSAGFTDEARKHFKMSLQFYPNSIPLLVYNYQLEEDPKKKKEQLKVLKKIYPKHWMVKGL